MGGLPARGPAFRSPRPAEEPADRLAKEEPNPGQRLPPVPPTSGNHAPVLVIRERSGPAKVTGGAGTEAESVPLRFILGGSRFRRTTSEAPGCRGNRFTEKQP